MKSIRIVANRMPMASRLWRGSALIGSGPGDPPADLVSLASALRSIWATSIAAFYGLIAQRGRSCRGASRAAARSDRPGLHGGLRALAGGRPRPARGAAALRD